MRGSSIQESGVLQGGVKARGNDDIAALKTVNIDIAERITWRWANYVSDVFLFWLLMGDFPFLNECAMREGCGRMGRMEARSVYSAMSNDDY